MGGAGATVGTCGNGFLPNLKGTVGTHNHSLSNIDGVLFKASSFGSSAGLSGVGSFANIATFNASAYNSIYTDTATMVIPAYAIIGGYIIKYI